jgi:tellurite resistance protein TerA
MVFFNQLAAPGNAVTLALQDNAATFTLQVAQLPETIARLVFVASMDGAGTMRDLGPSALRLGSGTFAFQGGDFAGEKAVIIAEIYRRDGVWRFGAVGQGFAGGLDALLAHFGGTQAASPTPAPAAPAKVNIAKVTLTKPGQSHTISLAKGPAAPVKLVVKATWEDNGDDDDGNDDLDLRVGVLLPDGRMTFVCAPDKPGSFEAAPYLRHLGDVQVASKAEPATETVEVNPQIAQKNGGRVALVFSIYSAVGNGLVPVSSLRPKMRMEYGAQVVECAFDFMKSKAAGDDAVYTYVVGTAIIDGDSVTLAPSGRTSESGSENTPWLKWRGRDIVMSMDGPVIFKGEDGEEDLDDLETMSQYRYT